MPSVSSGGSGIFDDLVGPVGESALVKRWESASKTSVSLSWLIVLLLDGVSWAASKALSRSISALAVAKSWGVSLGLLLEGPAVRCAGAITLVFRQVARRVFG